MQFSGITKLSRCIKDERSNEGPLRNIIKALSVLSELPRVDKMKGMLLIAKPLHPGSPLPSPPSLPIPFLSPNRHSEPPFSPFPTSFIQSSLRLSLLLPRATFPHSVSKILFFLHFFEFFTYFLASIFHFSFEFHFSLKYERGVIGNHRALE